MDTRVPFSDIQDAFGVPATVVRPESHITTVVVWHPPTQDLAPATGEFRGAATVRILAVSKADVDALPDGTEISCPEVPEGPVRNWIVDGQFKSDDDHWRVMVLPAEAA
jgi:hypothetical protein